MKQVWKYPIPVHDLFELALPFEAEVLCVQVQAGQPCIWVLVDNDFVAEQARHFRLAGTGHPIPEKIGRYIGTFQLHGGALVFHLWELAG